MEFNKYTKIENHYQNKIVNRFLDGGQTDVLYQLTEKIDGANFQVIITKDSVRFGKRTNYLGEDESFFDWQNTIASCDILEFARRVQEHILKGNNTIQFFFELYGKGIQKRINYGGTKSLCVYEAKFDGKYLPPRDLINILTVTGFRDLHVPIITYVDGLEKALAFDTERPSVLSPTDDEIEGVVIKPYKKVIYSGEKRLIFKKKNKRFSEKMNVKSKDRISKVYTAEELEFMGYINENRMAGIISKYGEPNDPKLIGKYIGLIGEDAINDYIKDKDINLADTAKKKLKNLVGRLALPLIKKYL